MPGHRQNNLQLFVLLTIAIGFLLWFTQRISWDNGLAQLQEQNRQQLDQFVGHLDAQLARFQFLPQLVAKNRLLVDVLNDPDNTSRIDLVNRFLQDINSITGASDTYLMNQSGLTLAASNWQSERPFVGKNFSFRPYFTQAINGLAGRYFALGTTSGERGYYFSYPIMYAASIIGAIVIKMDLSNIEKRWSGRTTQFIVSDPDGVIFIATQSDWLYRSLQPLSESTSLKIKNSRRYGDFDIQALGMSSADSSPEDNLIVQIKSAATDYLGLKHSMPDAGWNVMILAPLNTIKRNSFITMAVVLLSALLLLLISLLAWQRYKRQQERERFQLEAQKQLEQQVSIRTADLTQEIEDHKQTEKRLRDTQGELIQTAKLAVLGQMSASISHELNNPLAAIRSYADNARQFLALDKIQNVDQNLNRIAELTERMGKISSQLKFFARKASGNLEKTKIGSVIQNAIELVRPQFKTAPVEFYTEQLEKNLKVKADIVQLEQVLVNLINNAHKAMQDSVEKKLSISSEQRDGWIMIHVDDSGPGIDESHLSKIFDPFFTTRKSGLGLGLSISARIIDSMQGHLSATNLKNHGARFTISMPAIETTS